MRSYPHMHQLTMETSAYPLPPAVPRLSHAHIFSSVRHCRDYRCGCNSSPIPIVKRITGPSVRELLGFHGNRIDRAASNVKIKHRSGRVKNAVKTPLFQPHTPHLPATSGGDKKHRMELACVFTSLTRELCPSPLAISPMSTEA